MLFFQHVPTFVILLAEILQSLHSCYGNIEFLEVFGHFSKNLHVVKLSNCNQLLSHSMVTFSNFLEPLTSTFLFIYTNWRMSPSWINVLSRATWAFLFLNRFFKIIFRIKYFLYAMLAMNLQFILQNVYIYAVKKIENIHESSSFDHEKYAHWLSMIICTFVKRTIFMWIDTNCKCLIALEKV
jgi:hypothetical protein